MTIRIVLGWPAKELSPNARVHRMALSRFKKSAREEGEWSARIAVGKGGFKHDGPLPVRVLAHPPLAWRTGDDDNLIARLKSHFDGIAKGLGVNDRQFEQGGVEWGDRCANGQVVVEVGA